MLVGFAGRDWHRSFTCLAAVHDAGYPIASSSDSLIALRRHGADALSFQHAGVLVQKGLMLLEFDPVWCQLGRKGGQNGVRYWQYEASSRSIQEQRDGRVNSLRPTRLQYKKSSFQAPNDRLQNPVGAIQ